MIQDRPIRGFFLSLGLLGVVWLAFNPYTVVDTQKSMAAFPAPAAPSPKNVDGFDESETVTPNRRPPLDLPTTHIPNTTDLPRIAGFEKLARNDPWIGPTPCSANMFSAPTILSSLSPKEIGPRQTEPIKSAKTQWIKDQPTYLYKSERGVTLKLVQPVVEYYSVYGQHYRDARKDIFTRQPLKSLRQSENKRSSNVPSGDKKNHSDDQEVIRIEFDLEKARRERVASLADISSPSSLSYRISGSRDRFRLNVKDTVLTASFLITLPRWIKYDQANERDQKKWDDLLCNAAHHELGHLRIRLDILAETLDGYADLPPAQSFKEMEEIVIAFRKDINARVETRQEAYHVYNGGGIRRGMIELPYADLPFPWLEENGPKMAEQLPAQQ